MYKFLHSFVIALSGDVSIIEACSGKVPGWLEAGTEKKLVVHQKMKWAEVQNQYLTVLWVIWEMQLTLSVLSNTKLCLISKKNLESDLDYFLRKK